MNDVIKRLLRLNIEIDGSLRSLMARPCDESLEILCEKVGDFNSLLATLIPDKQAEEEVVTESAPVAEIAPEPEEEPFDLKALIASAEVAQDDKAVENDIPTPEAAPEPTPEPAQPEDEFSIPEEEFESQLDEVVSDTGIIDTDVDELSDEIESMISAEDVPQLDEVTEITDETETTSEQIPEAVEDAETQQAEDEQTIVGEKAKEHTPLASKPTIADKYMVANDYRVEDMIVKKKAVDLAKTFTVNDKYKFVRGLFCDDRSDFEYTVSKISTFESLGDVYEYLLNEQGWDIDNDEVKEFIKIITKYFNTINADY